MEYRACEGVMAELEAARCIGEDPAQGWDAAARYLGKSRREYAARISVVGGFYGLVEVVTLQMECLRRAEDHQRAVDIGVWFHHILHDLPSDLHSSEERYFLRNSLSRFFVEYAKNLCKLGRYEEMRLSMRSALDASLQLPMVIVSLVHLYAPLESICETIEEEPVRVWLLKRYAECLAALDFAGQSKTLFRETLDDYQAGLRNPEKRAEIGALIKGREDAEDPALSTLIKLYELHFLRN